MPLKVIPSEATVINCVAVAAGKGGVGKSTVAVLLAAAFKRLGQRVGILDADLYGPSMRHLLPEEQMPEKRGNQWLPALSCGIKLFSYAFFTQEAAVRAPMANQVLRQFLSQIVWGPLDSLFIDFPPGTGDIPLTISQLIPLRGAILVTMPQKISILDVKKTIHMFRKMHVPLIGIIENMSGVAFGSGGGEALAAEEGIPFLGSIPLDPAISTSADEGRLATLELEFLPPLVTRLKENLEKGEDLGHKVSLADRKHLKIVWQNGTISFLPAAVLQRACPCASCIHTPPEEGDVVIQSFEAVGKYGIRFTFSSGCSAGIYPFELLMRLTQ